MSENQIDLYSRINDPIAAIEKAGSFFAKSGMFGCDRLEQGMVLAMACMAERKSPVEIAATYHLQDGKLSMKAEAMLGRFHGIGGKSKLVSRTPEKAEVELTKLDGSKSSFTFTLEEAKTEDYVYAKDGKTFKKNWSTPRKRMQMLWARVISDGVRAMAPEVLNGSYTPEEISEDAPTVEPAKQVLTTATTETKPTPHTPKPEPKIVDAEIVHPKTETASPEPTTTLAASTREIFVAKANEKGELTNETILALANAIGDENSSDFINWLLLKQWIPKISRDGMETGELRKLSVQRAQRILDKPEVVLNFIRGELKAAETK